MQIYELICYMLSSELKAFLVFNFEENFLPQEILRIKSGFDIENNDRLKKKLKQVSIVRFDENQRIFYKLSKTFPKNKSETLSLIRNAHKGIKIEIFLNSYENCKQDLLDLVKISGRNRKLMIIKGSDNFSLSFFPSSVSHWIFVSRQTIQKWHTIQRGKK